MKDYSRYLDICINKLIPYIVIYNGVYYLELTDDNYLLLDKSELSKENDTLIVEDICDFVVEKLQMFLNGYGITGYYAYNEYEGVVVL